METSDLSGEIQQGEGVPRETTAASEMSRAQNEGFARIVEGSLPSASAIERQAETIPEEGSQLHFRTAHVAESTNEEIEMSNVTSSVSILRSNSWASMEVSATLPRGAQIVHSPNETEVSISSIPCEMQSNKNNSNFSSVIDDATVDTSNVSATSSETVVFAEGNPVDVTLPEETNVDFLTKKTECHEIVSGESTGTESCTTQNISQFSSVVADATVDTCNGSATSETAVSAEGNPTDAIEPEEENVDFPTKKTESQEIESGDSTGTESNTTQNNSQFSSVTTDATVDTSNVSETSSKTVVSAEGNPTDAIEPEENVDFPTKKTESQEIKSDDPTDTESNITQNNSQFSSVIAADATVDTSNVSVTSETVVSTEGNPTDVIEPEEKNVDFPTKKTEGHEIKSDDPTDTESITTQNISPTSLSKVQAYKAFFDGKASAENTKPLVVVDTSIKSISDEGANIETASNNKMTPSQNSKEGNVTILEGIPETGHSSAYDESKEIESIDPVKLNLEKSEDLKIENGGKEKNPDDKNEISQEPFVSSTLKSEEKQTNLENVPSLVLPVITITGVSDVEDDSEDSEEMVSGEAKEQVSTELEKVENEAKLSEETKAGENEAKLTEEIKTGEDEAKLTEENKAGEEAKLSEETKAGEDEAKLSEETKAVEDEAKLSEETKAVEDEAKLSEETKAGEDEAKLSEETKAGEDEAKLTEEIKAGEDEAKLPEEIKDENFKDFQPFSHEVERSDLLETVENGANEDLRSVGNTEIEGANDNRMTFDIYSDSNQSVLTEETFSNKEQTAASAPYSPAVLFGDSEVSDEPEQVEERKEFFCRDTNLVFKQMEATGENSTEVIQRPIDYSFPPFVRRRRETCECFGSRGLHMGIFMFSMFVVYIGYSLYQLALNKKVPDIYETVGLSTSAIAGGIALLSSLYIGVQWCGRNCLNMERMYKPLYDIETTSLDSCGHSHNCYRETVFVDADVERACRQQETRDNVLRMQQDQPSTSGLPDATQKLKTEVTGLLETLADVISEKTLRESADGDFTGEEMETGLNSSPDSSEPSVYASAELPPDSKDSPQDNAPTKKD